MLLALSSYTANAALFNFSFSNEDGQLNGFVQGTIELADGDGTFGATSVFITSAPSGLSYDPTGFNWVTGEGADNTFTVVGGEITTAQTDFFGLFNDNTGLELSYSRSFLDILDAGDYGETGVKDADSSTLTFSRASVPETASMFSLLALSLGMLFIIRLKK